MKDGLYDRDLLFDIHRNEEGVEGVGVFNAMY